MRGLIALSVLVCFMTGCVSLRTSDRYDYRELKDRLATVGLEPEKEKDSTTAALLNVLPGIGNAYLDQWGLFVVNFLFWPTSILWGIPQAATDAERINIKDTLYFYQVGSGKKRLEELETKALANKKINARMAPGLEK